MDEYKKSRKKELKKKSKKELITLLLEYDEIMDAALDYKESAEEALVSLANKRGINNVTTENLDLAIRMVGITLDKKTIDKIIDLVELLETKGDEVSIKDICELQAEWDDKRTTTLFDGKITTT